MLRRKTVELRPLQLRDLLAAGDRLRHRLAIHLVQERLMVERIEMAHPASQVNPDNPMHFGRMMQRTYDPAPAIAVGVFGWQRCIRRISYGSDIASPREMARQRSKRQRSQTYTGVIQER